MSSGKSKEEDGSSDLEIRGMVDSLRAGWSLYTGAFRPLLGLFLVVQLILFALNVGVAIATAASSSRGVQVAGIFALMIATAVTASYGYAVAARFLARRRSDTEVTTTRASLELRPFRRDLAIAGLYSSIVVAALFMLMGPTGQRLAIYVMTILFGPPLLAQVIAIEQRKMPDAWVRTRELGSREWGRMFMYLFTAVMILLVFQELSLVGIALLARSTLENASGIGIELAAQGLQRTMFAFSWPYIACTQLVLYLDVRARKDKLDGSRLEVELIKQMPEADTKEADASPG